MTTLKQWMTFQETHKFTLKNFILKMLTMLAGLGFLAACGTIDQGGPIWQAAIYYVLSLAWFLGLAHVNNYFYPTQHMEEECEYEEDDDFEPSYEPARIIHMLRRKLPSYLSIQK